MLHGSVQPESWQFVHVTVTICEMSRDSVSTWRVLFDVDTSGELRASGARSYQIILTIILTIARMIDSDH